MKWAKRDISGKTQKFRSSRGSSHTWAYFGFLHTDAARVYKLKLPGVMHGQYWHRGNELVSVVRTFMQILQKCDIICNPRREKGLELPCMSMLTAFH